MLSKGENQEQENNCKGCGVPQSLCVCEAITRQAAPLNILILQHPQEKKEVLNSAVLIPAVFKGAVLKSGLSWANLQKALDLKEKPDSKRYAVLHQLPRTKTLPKEAFFNGLAGVDKKGKAVAQSEVAKTLQNLEGIIILDGNWAQAKTMWWRNSWLLKVHRLVLKPRTLSRYGNLRRQPRPSNVSTLEATAEVLEILGYSKEAESLLAPFKLFLHKYRG